MNSPTRGKHERKTIQNYSVGYFGRGSVCYIAQKKGWFFWGRIHSVGQQSAYSDCEWRLKEHLRCIREEEKLRKVVALFNSQGDKIN